MPKTTNKNIWNYTPIYIGLIFVACASLHRIGLNSPGYTDSPLIAVVMLGMILLVVMSLVFLIGALVGLGLGLIKRDWSVFKFASINFIGVTVLTALGMYIDAPTILYMT